MSNRNELLAGAVLAVAVASGLALPAWSNAGTLMTDRPAATPPRIAAPGKPVYQVRCWQHGRLLFEQRDVDLSGDAIGGLKLRATDQYSHPVMVTDTGNATCLIRSQAGGR
jgi:hypothetical protein